MGPAYLPAWPERVFRLRQPDLVVPALRFQPFDPGHPLVGAYRARLVVTQHGNLLERLDVPSGKIRDQPWIRAQAAARARSSASGEMPSWGRISAA